jgi:hypothetical protein
MRASSTVSLSAREAVAVVVLNVLTLAAVAAVERLWPRGSSHAAARD